MTNNKWVFVQSEQTKLSIECESDELYETVIGTGYLNTPLNCVAFYKKILDS